MAFKPVHGAASSERRGGFKPVGFNRDLNLGTPLEDTTLLDRFFIGVGSGMTDLSLGVQQAFGADNRDEIIAKNQIDAAGGLDDSGMGATGEVVGKMALAAPAMFVPGANTAVGAGVIGAGLGAAEPTTDESVLRGKLKNAATGAAFGLAGHEVGKRAGQFIGNKLAARSNRIASQKTADSVKNATLEQGRKLGYKVNPVQANPSPANKVLEGYAGKISTAQKVAEYNQEITNKIARRSLGLADDTPLTPEALSAVRAQHGTAYKSISRIKDKFKADGEYIDDLAEIAQGLKDLGNDFPDYKTAGAGIDDLVDSLLVDNISAKSAAEIVKDLRFQSTANFKAFDNPQKRALAFAQKRASQALDSLIGRNLKRLGMDDLHKDWHKAREMIAKTHTVERALNEGSGNVISRKLAHSYSKGDPLTGELQDAAKYAQTFDRATQEIKSSMPGISPLDAGVGIIAGSSGGGFNMKALIAAMAGRPLARNIITSKPWQAAMTRPTYRGHSGLIKAMRGAPAAGAIAAPSVYLQQK